jgi:hypothetical protein
LRVCVALGGPGSSPLPSLICVLGLTGVAAPAPATGMAATSAVPPRCARLAPAGPTATDWTAAKHDSVPTPVAAIRLCRYGETRLVRAARLSNSQTTTLGSADTALRKRPGRGLRSCFVYVHPVVAEIAYPDAHTLTVYTPTASCVEASNGAIARNGPASARKHLRGVLLRYTR